MNKELLIRLATGMVAKGIRYGLVACGGIGAAGSVEKDGVNIDQLAIGITTMLVSFGWSMWEDRIKKRQAPPAPPPTPPPPA